jgi:hypothetical protein
MSRGLNVAWPSSAQVWVEEEVHRLPEL